MKTLTGDRLTLDSTPGNPCVRTEEMVERFSVVLDEE
jgi:hypothetical protein